VQTRVWASSDFYRRGKLRKLAHAVLEHRNLFKGGAAILADSQNGDIIVLSLSLLWGNNFSEDKISNVEPSTDI
jgi:hypothetical protein